MVAAWRQGQTGAMPPDLPPHLLAVALVFLAAGVVKGVLGLGLPTLAMGLLGLYMPVPAAATLLIVPSLATNLWQGVVGPGGLRLARRLGLMLLGIVLGTLAGAPLARSHGDALGRQALGLCLLVYGASSLLGWRMAAIPTRLQCRAGLVVGTVTGVLTGLTGVFVLPAVPYLQSLGLARDAFAQALGLCFSAATLALAGALALQGQLDARASVASAGMVVPAVAGMVLGQALRGRLSERHFRRLFFLGMTLLGGWQMLH